MLLSTRATRFVPTLARARPFSLSVRQQKSATETAKDTLKTVDRAISDNLVKGIDKTAEAAEAAKANLNSTTGSAQGKASEVAGQAKGKAQEMQGQAKSAMDGNSGSAKGKAEELKGEAKGKAEEIKGTVKGKVEEVKGKMS
ncbi:hypothetical protein CAC42_6926 [Sphaceloma murrayae]|uniref:Uncharacterized protein n=1 Tax=Sphaceloma murrayae TaxID=2082308 RepID=A0A2K1QQV4_9PEZI|nr:hypothetical protein CAC42_6926 [Sphaceloma murrayae]